jgi:hypothetical protein
VARNWEVVLEGRHVRRISDDTGEPRSSLEDTGLFAKGVVREGSLQEKSGPSVAVEVGPLLPTIHGESGAGFSLAAICSQQFSKLTVHLNGATLRTRAGYDFRVFLPRFQHAFRISATTMGATP